MYFYDRISPRASSLLDLVRWGAAELVVLTHVREQFFQNWAHVAQGDRSLLNSMLYLMSAIGHQAVVIFFVLSGFLVGGSAISDCLRQRFSLAHFVINRFSRIYVVLIPALLMGGVLDRIGIGFINPAGLYTGGMPDVIDYRVDQALPFRYLAGNAANLQEIAVPTYGSNHPLWSLSYEWWYYILFPLLLITVLPQVRPLMRAAAGVLAIGLGIALYPVFLAFFSVWLIGVAVRFCPRPLIPWPSVMAVILVMGMILSNRILGQHPESKVYDCLSSLLLAVIFAIFLLSLMHRRSLAERPAIPWCAHLSGYSYSLYLTHFPMLMLISACCAQWWGISLGGRPHQWTAWFVPAIVAVLVNGYGWLFARLTEHHTIPVRNALMAVLGLSRIGKPAAALAAAEQVPQPASSRA